MRTHTDTFKKNISSFGREISAKITYIENNETIVLSNEEINSITYSCEADLLKSVMTSIQIDTNVFIEKGTRIKFEFGVYDYDLQNYEYIDFKYFYITNVEYQEDTKSYLLTCYDKMILAMKDYIEVPMIYPTTIRNYMIDLCDVIGIDFADSETNFANYDKEIPSDLFKDLNYTYRDVLDQLAQVTASIICINDDEELEIRYANQTVGKNLFNLSNGQQGGIDQNGSYTSNTQNWRAKDYIKVEPNTTYTFSIKNTINHYTLRLYEYDENKNFITPRSVISDNNLTITTTANTQYLKYTIYKQNTTMTQSVINGMLPQIEKGNVATNYEVYGENIYEDFLKEDNVSFGKKIGKINSIVLSRSAESDTVYLRDEQSVLQDGLYEIKIVDNQIMNFNNRADFLPDILEKLDGLEFYSMDVSSTGICYLSLYDKYVFNIGNKNYNCVLLNDEININQGLNENIYVEEPKVSETEYKYANEDDRKINQTWIIVNKQEGTINELVSRVTANEQNITQININANAIQQDVIEIQTNVDSNGEAINTLSNQVQTLQTSTSLQINTINQTLENGVEKLSNSLVTIDVNGINTSKEGETFNTQTTNKSYEVKDGDKTLVFIGYDENKQKTVARIPELEAKQITAGVHRCETIERNNKKRTAWFYIGGDN